MYWIAAASVIFPDNTFSDWTQLADIQLVRIRRRSPTPGPFPQYCYALWDANPASVKDVALTLERSVYLQRPEYIDSNGEVDLLIIHPTWILSDQIPLGNLKNLEWFLLNKAFRQFRQWEGCLISVDDGLESDLASILRVVYSGVTDNQIPGMSSRLRLIARREHTSF